MPKTPDKKNWKDAYQLRRDQKSKFNELLWRVGNVLALPASINKSIKNKGIAHKISNSKKGDYSNCSFELPKKARKYLDNGEWSPKSIDDFQAYIAKYIAAEAWKL